MRRIPLLSLLTALWIIVMLSITPIITGLNISAADEIKRVDAGIKMPPPDVYFKIKIIDRETGRGIPLVKVESITGLINYTDSAGVIAFFEPALMNRDVYFTFESPGYSIEKDPFDGFGKTIAVKQDGDTVISMKRENIAERLYRITGSGIYSDSAMLGEKIPIKEPILNAGVLGQDSVWTAFYKGKMFWLWGDTTNAAHPLKANFKTTCAVSNLPFEEGADPDKGIDLTYFSDSEFVRKMMPYGKSNPYWMYNLISVPDKERQEKLLAGFIVIKPPLEAIEKGIAVFNDEKGIFDILKSVSMDEIISPDGHPMRYLENGTDYVYFFSDKLTRVRFDYDSIINHDKYEALTCLKQGEKFSSDKSIIERDKDGKLIFSWKTSTAPTGNNELEKLINDGIAIPQEKWIRLIDVQSGKEIKYHNGSLYYNEFRKRWTLIFSEVFGSSMLGEVWYAEADSPTGLFSYARKVVTHPKYSYYNPLQHPYFSKEGGRFIYFEGTYTKSFSGNEIQTPRYEYNQLMYRLDLKDERLILPLPVYVSENFVKSYQTIDKFNALERNGLHSPFFAQDRESSGTIAVYRVFEGKQKSPRLSLSLPKASAEKTQPAFFAVAPDSNRDTAAGSLINLYEFYNKSEKIYYYSLDPDETKDGYTRSEKPLCKVWQPSSTCKVLFSPK